MLDEGNASHIRTNAHLDCFDANKHSLPFIGRDRLTRGHRTCKMIKSILVTHFSSAIKNQATGHYILNGKGEEAKSRTFIDLGVEWDYNIEDDIETLHTDGPLHDPVIVLVCGITVSVRS